MPNILANVDRPARASLRTAVCSLVLCLSLVLLSTASRGEDAGPSHAQLTIIHPFAPGGGGYDLGQVIGDRFPAALQHPGSRRGKTRREYGFGRDVCHKVCARRAYPGHQFSVDYCDRGVTAYGPAL